jgi:hypothetical protein
MLRSVQIGFKNWPPLPTFLKQLFKEKQYRIRGGYLFASVEWKAENGQILHIHDGQFSNLYTNGEYKFTLNVVNKMDKKNWFKIGICLDSSNEEIWRLSFSPWKMKVI